MSKISLFLTGILLVFGLESCSFNSTLGQNLENKNNLVTENLNAKAFSGYYKIVCKLSGKVLDVTGGETATANGDNVQQWSWNGGDHQQWSLVSVGSYYKIVVKHSGKVLDVTGGESATANGANVQQWSWNGNDNQLWSVSAVGNYYKITAKHSGKVLDVTDLSVENGANVQQWAWGGGDNQLWQIVSAGTPPANTTIWYGDPNQPFNSVFSVFEAGNAPLGTVGTVNDPVYGKSWRVNKPAGNKRAEIHGAKGVSENDGRVLYYGWRVKVSMPNVTPGGFPVFQWKSYGANILQNYPLLLSYSGSSLILSKYNTDGTHNDLCVMPLAHDTWASVVLCVKISRNASIGYVEFYWNGVKQTLLTGGTRVYHRTLDGDNVDPKWGAYNGNIQPYNVSVYLNSMKIATDLAGALP